METFCCGVVFSLFNKKINKKACLSGGWRYRKRRTEICAICVGLLIPQMPGPPPPSKAMHASIIRFFSFLKCNNLQKRPA